MTDDERARVLLAAEIFDDVMADLAAEIQEVADPRVGHAERIERYKNNMNRRLIKAGLPALPTASRVADLSNTTPPPPDPDARAHTTPDSAPPH